MADMNSVLAGLQGGYPASGSADLGRKQALLARAQTERDLANRDVAPLSRQIGGPLPDPNWDAYFQAMKEGGVENATDTLAPPRGYKQESPGSSFDEHDNYWKNPSVVSGLKNYYSKNPRAPFTPRGQ